jgi:hypothetical protein
MVGFKTNGYYSSPEKNFKIRHMRNSGSHFRKTFSKIIFYSKYEREREREGEGLGRESR